MLLDGLRNVEPFVEQDLNRHAAGASRFDEVSQGALEPAAFILRQRDGLHHLGNVGPNSHHWHPETMDVENKQVGVIPPGQHQRVLQGVM
jgi:hypothetical protein